MLGNVVIADAFFSLRRGVNRAQTYIETHSLRGNCRGREGAAVSEKAETRYKSLNKTVKKEVIK